MSRPILIYRLGSLGDTVVALPCFHQIARAFRGRRRIVLTNIPVSSKAAALDLILRPSGLIDGVLDYPIGMRSPLTALSLARRIRAIGADTLIYLSAPRGAAAIARDMLFFRLCGLHTIIGAPSRPDLRENRTDSSGFVEPEAERLARSLALLGPIDLHDRANWDLRLLPEEIKAADQSLAPLENTPFFAINVGGKAVSNDWGEENWQALRDRMAGDVPNLAIVALGGGDDVLRSSALLADWPGRTLNLCGALAPRESAAVLRQARFFIGHDSGPMHLAAAVGTPTVGIFGDNNRPRKWHPYGAGHRPVHDVRGVRTIPVERVYHAAIDLAAAAR